MKRPGARVRTLLRCAQGIALAIPALAIPALAGAAQFENSIAQRVLACTGCHGPAGRAAPDGYYPRIAGKPAGYLFRQLVAFRDGARRYAPMTGLLRNLDDAYLREIAGHFAAQHPPHPAPAAARDAPSALARGRELAQHGDKARDLPACAACHGRTLAGVAPDVPGLLGLPRDYLNAQVGAFALGERQGHPPDCMGKVARRLPRDDVVAVTAWLAAQPVPDDTRPADRAAQPMPIDCGPTPAPSGSSADGAPASRAPRSPRAPAPGHHEPIDAAAAGSSATIARGAYLGRIGNCAGCHSLPGGAPLAGGRAIVTPFGRVYPPNITQDPVHGIGRWSADDLWQAFRTGRAPDGRLLNPAFPFVSFANLTRADSDAIHAWLRTVPAVARENRAHEMRFPFGTQAALAAWRFAFFRPAPARAHEGDRGEYLVSGPGHCAACHARRNRAGAIPEPGRLDGATMPGGRWHAPPVSGPDPQRRAYLRTGASESRVALGPMADIVHDSTSWLSDADLDAVLVHLAGQPAATPRPAPAPGSAQATAPGPETQARDEPGAALYERHCADCHGRDGRGRAGAYPPLAGNPTVLADPPINLVRIVLDGGFAPSTPANPRPFGMPPFAQVLERRALADVLGFVRRAWGNRAPPVDARTIERQLAGGQD